MQRVGSYLSVGFIYIIVPSGFFMCGSDFLAFRITRILLKTLETEKVGAANFAQIMHTHAHLIYSPFIHYIKMTIIISRNSAHVQKMSSHIVNFLLKFLKNLYFNEILTTFYYFTWSML